MAWQNRGCWSRCRSVSGPASVTDRAVAIWDGTTGCALTDDSEVTVDTSHNVILGTGSVVLENNSSTCGMYWGSVSSGKRVVLVDDKVYVDSDEHLQLDAGYYLDYNAGSNGAGYHQFYIDGSAAGSIDRDGDWNVGRHLVLGTGDTLYWGTTSATTYITESSGVLDLRASGNVVLDATGDVLVQDSGTTWATFDGSAEVFYVDGAITIGTAGPRYSGVIADLRNSPGNTTPVAIIENQTAYSTGRVLQLRLADSAPGTSDDWIQFVANGADFGAISGDGAGNTALRRGSTTLGLGVYTPVFRYYDANSRSLGTTPTVFDFDHVGHVGTTTVSYSSGWFTASEDGVYEITYEFWADLSGVDLAVWPKEDTGSGTGNVNYSGSDSGYPIYRVFPLANGKTQGTITYVKAYSSGDEFAAYVERQGSGSGHVDRATVRVQRLV